ncbi:unnamed protein product, partial [Ixodes pacificus]
MGWPVLTDDNTLRRDARVKAPFRLTDTFKSTAICFHLFLILLRFEAKVRTTVWAECLSSIKANMPKRSVSVASSYCSQSKITTGPPKKKVLLADSGNLGERQGHYLQEWFHSWPASHVLQNTVSTLSTKIEKLG